MKLQVWSSELYQILYCMYYINYDKLNLRIARMFINKKAKYL